MFQEGNKKKKEKKNLGMNKSYHEKMLLYIVYLELMYVNYNFKTIKKERKQYRENHFCKRKKSKRFASVGATLPKTQRRTAVEKRCRGINVERDPKPM